MPVYIIVTQYQGVTTENCVIGYNCADRYPAENLILKISVEWKHKTSIVCQLKRMQHCIRVVLSTCALTAERMRPMELQPLT